MKKKFTIIPFVTFLCLGFNIGAMTEDSERLMTFNSLEDSIDLPDFEITSFEGLKAFFDLPKESLADFVISILDKCIKAEQRRLSNENFWENQIQDKSIFNDYFYYLEKEDVGSKNINYIIIGDLHGNFDDFENVLKDLIKRKILNENLELIFNYKIICLGDYVDRGPKSLETVLTLMILRLINSDSVILLRGNHENFSTFFKYGFFEELASKLYATKLNIEELGCELFFEDKKYNFPKIFHEYFTLLPTAYFLKKDNLFFQFNHSGWSYFDISRLLFKNRFFILTPFQADNFTWSDLIFDEKIYSEFNKQRKKGFVYSTSKVFSCMNDSNIVVKFGGHIHNLLGMRDNEYGNKFDKKRGYYCFTDYNIIIDRFILILISASIYSYFGSDNFDYNYNPTYLELNIKNTKDKYFRILGSSKKNKSQFYTYLIKAY